VWEKYAHWYITEETEVFTQDQRELDFYRQIRGETGDPCLEIGAGYGRLARSLSGPSVTAALEPSPAMLAGWTEADSALACRVRSPGQSLPFRDSVFGLVTFPYNGIQCILSRSERFDVLRESCRVLIRGGSFVLEVCHAFSFRPEESGSRRYRTRLDSGRTVQLVESISRCVEERSITYDMTYSDSDGKSENIVLRLALIEPDELVDELGRAGFSSVQLTGDYDGTPFSGEDSPRLLVRAVKGEKT
jgi:ubiquinone/menaquinone biosynthesis C-methylase UbiE